MSRARARARRAGCPARGRSARHRAGGPAAVPEQRDHERRAIVAAREVSVRRAGASSISPDRRRPCRPPDAARPAVRVPAAGVRAPLEQRPRPCVSSPVAPAMPAGRCRRPAQPDQLRATVEQLGQPLRIARLAASYRCANGSPDARSDRTWRPNPPRSRSRAPRHHLPCSGLGHGASQRANAATAPGPASSARRSRPPAARGVVEVVAVRVLQVGAVGGHALDVGPHLRRAGKPCSRAMTSWASARSGTSRGCGCCACNRSAARDPPRAPHAAGPWRGAGAAPGWAKREAWAHDILVLGCPVSAASARREVTADRPHEGGLGPFHGRDAAGPRWRNRSVTGSDAGHLHI